MLCFPLDNVEYEALALGAWFGTRTRGVFSAEGNLAVTANGDMTVMVSPGISWMKADEYWGVCGYQQDSATLSIATADTALPRIDAICVRLNKNANLAEIVVKQGAYSTDPVVAAPVRDINFDELYIATIKVSAGATSILASDITDTRLNEELCGLMRDGVTRIPTDELQSQAQALIRLISDELARLNAGTEVMLKTEYAPDAAAVFEDGNFAIAMTYEKPNTLYSILFTAPASYRDGNTFSVNGTPCEARALDGSSLQSGAFVEGAVVFCHISGTTIWLNAPASTAPANTGTLEVQVGGEYTTGRVSVSSTQTGTVILQPDSMGGVSFNLTAGITYTVSMVELPVGYYSRKTTAEIIARETTVVTLDVTTAPPIYGFRITRSDGTVTYTEDAIDKEPASMGDTFAPGSWGSEWPFNEIRPCMLNGGVVQYYLDPDDYTKKIDGTDADITTGADGDVMVEFPIIYTKEWSDGTYDYVNLTAAPLDGYHANGFTNANGIVQDTAYMAAYDGYNISSNLRSVSGKAPTVSQTIGTFRTWATARGAGYQQHQWIHRTLLFNLFVLMFRGLNSQTLLGRGNVNTSAAKATGTMNTRGMYWGDQGSSNGVKFCGIENPWGNIWKFCDGLGVNSGNKIVYKTGPSYADALTNYLDTGITRGTSNYVSQMTVGNGMGKIASQLSGAETTFYSDYWWFNATAGTYICRVGGDWAHTSQAGLFAVALNTAASNSHTSIGASLSYIPQ